MASRILIYLNQKRSWSKHRLCGARLQHRRKASSSGKIIEATTSSGVGSATSLTSSTLLNHLQRLPLGDYTSNLTVPGTQPQMQPIVADMMSGQTGALQ